MGNSVEVLAIEQILPEWGEKRRERESTELCSLIEQNPTNEAQTFISPLTLVSL